MCSCQAVYHAGLGTTLPLRKDESYQRAQASVLIFLQGCPGLVIIILPLEGLQICDLLIPDACRHTLKSERGQHIGTA